MNKTLLTIIVVVVLVIIAGGVYFFAVQNNTGQTDNQSGTDFFSSLFPFGESSPGGGDVTTSGDSTLAETKPASVLRQIGDRPVAGARFIAGRNETLIRFIERETGHVFDTPLDSATVTRISNTTIPRIQEIVWLSD